MPGPCVAGRRPEIVILGLTGDEQLELVEQGVIEADQGQVGFNTGLDGGIREAFGDAGTVGFVGDLFADLGQVVLAVGVLDMSQQLGPFAHQIGTAAQQVAGGAHLGRIDVGHRDHAAAQQDGDFLGIDTIVFGFAAMDGFHIEGMT